MLSVKMYIYVVKLLCLTFWDIFDAGVDFGGGHKRQQADLHRGAVGGDLGEGERSGGHCGHLQGHRQGQRSFWPGLASML